MRLRGCFWGRLLGPLGLLGLQFPGRLDRVEHLFDGLADMEAGDWKSSTVFLETYVHTRNAGRTVADRFNSMSFEADL